VIHSGVSATMFLIDPPHKSLWWPNVKPDASSSASTKDNVQPLADETDGGTD
jgi:hypothetical protein